MSRHTSKATRSHISRGQRPGRSRRAIVLGLVGLVIVAGGAFWVGKSFLAGDSGDVEASSPAGEDLTGMPSGVSARTPAPIRSGPPPTPSANPAQPPSSPSSDDPESPPAQQGDPEPDTGPGPTATYELVASWTEGFVPNFIVTNKANRPRNFELKLTYPEDFDIKVVKSWNIDVESADGGVLTFTGGPVNPGKDLRVGFEATKSKPDEVNPTACTINGAEC